MNQRCHTVPSRRLIPTALSITVALGIGCAGGGDRDDAERTPVGGAASGTGTGGASASSGAPASTGAGAVAGAVPSGGVATGGASQGGEATGGLTAGGGAELTGGAAATGGAASSVDCSGIVSAGYELCTSDASSCGVVFTDGAGCSAVCATAGLVCLAALENLDGACAADATRPGVACDSGHLSDYCQCGGASSGTGGTAGSGGTGAAGAAGAGTGGTAATGGTGLPAGSDCNDITDQPIVTVSGNGGADYSRVADAIASISASNATPTQIRIAPGEYHEKLLVDRPNITLCGQKGQAEATRITYDDSARTLSAAGTELGTSGSYSVKITASDVAAEHLTIENGTGPGVQAVALMVQSDRAQFRDCRLIGYQDTLYVHSGTQYFRDCFIQGSTDFIFGAATAVFQDSTLHSAAGAMITAPSTEQSVPFGLVFLGGRATAASEVRAGGVGLGRNWRPYGATAYIRTELGAHISGVGWSPMGENTLATARFAEYQTTGPGANPDARAPESRQLSAAEAAEYTVDNIFGSWTPTFSR